MVKIYNAFTTEIDDPEAAAREIIQQLNPAENARKNTICIIHFYREFVETGTYQAVVDALQFEKVGCLSTYIGTNGQYGDVALSVTMITGDIFNFGVRTIDDVKSKTREQIAGEVTQICSEFRKKGNLKLVMPYMNPQQTYSCDDLITTVNSMPDPVPLFGTMAFNMEDVVGPHYVLGNGKLSSDMYVFVAYYGDFEPKFRVTSSFAFDENFGNTAEITEAEGSILKMVNGMTAVEYLKKQGMITADNTVKGTGIWAVPAILTYPNGTKVVRAFIGIVEGTEHIFSTGAMEAGAKIMFAYMDGGKTLASAEQLFNDAKDTKENGIIAFSCAARSWSLGTEFFAESQKIAECAEEYQKVNGQPLGYCVTYSGGEICPIKDSDGKYINTLHNYTLASCAFC